MGRKKKKTGETKTSEPNPFGVKKAPKKKSKKKRKKKKKVKQRESCSEIVAMVFLIRLRRERWLWRKYCY